MKLINIATRLEAQGLNVRQEYWANEGEEAEDDRSPEVVVHVAGGNANRPVQKITYDKENNLIIVEVPA